MRHVIRLFGLPLLTLALIVSVIVGNAPRVGAQQNTGSRKKVLFFSYPGVGAPGSHGHASLKPAEEQSAEWGKTSGFEVTALKGSTGEVQHFADHIIAERGVRYGQIVVIPADERKERARKQT